MKIVGRLALPVALASLLFPAAAPAAPVPVRCNIALDRETVPAGASQTVVVKIALDAPEIPREGTRPPVNLALVLDRSGSMSGDKIAKAREAAIEGLRRLTDRDLFSLVAYDHEVKTLVPAQSAGRTEWIEGRIRGIEPRGNTALFGAVSQGAAEVRRHVSEPYIHRVVLLSDGLANVGPSSPEDLGRLGAALLKEGISVTTVGIGDSFNEDLMTRLAQKSDGNHYFVESSRDLPRIFAAELGDVLSVVARKVVVEIECPQGVRPLRVIGRDGSIRGNRVEIRLNQLYGGQQKYALVELQVPPAQPEEIREIAVARCTYEDAVTQTMQRFSSRAQLRFSGEPEVVRRSANPAVQQDLVQNEMAEARDQALDLYNAGRKEEAVHELRQRSQALQERAAELGFRDLAGQAQALEQDAAQFEAEGLGSVEKKALRSESYRVRSQQKTY